MIKIITNVLAVLMPDDFQNVKPSERPDHPIRVEVRKDDRDQIKAITTILPWADPDDHNVGRTTTTISSSYDPARSIAACVANAYYMGWRDAWNGNMGPGERKGVFRDESDLPF